MAYTPGTPFYQAPFNLLDLLKQHAEPIYIQMNVRSFSMDEIKWEEDEKVQVRFVEKKKRCRKRAFLFPSTHPTHPPTHSIHSNG